MSSKLRLLSAVRASLICLQSAPIPLWDKLTTVYLDKGLIKEESKLVVLLDLSLILLITLSQSAPRAGSAIWLY